MEEPAGGGCLGVTRSTSRGPFPHRGVVGAGPPSTAKSMGSLPVGEGAGEPVREGTDGGGRAEHCLNVAVWSLPQLQQWGGLVGHQDGTGLLFPPLGQVGF